jgi:plasmid stabilization system protein ParE
VARRRATPKLGKPGRGAGTRELVIAGAPFLLIYALGDNRLEILHVKHERQQWPPEEEGEDEPA